MATTSKDKLYLDEQIDLGLIPEEMQQYEVPGNWVWTRLGAITSIVGGGTPPTHFNEYYDNGTISWLSPIDLSDYNDIYISHGHKNITELGLQKSSTYLLPKDTVLLSTRAPIGYVAIAANELCTSQGFKNFLPSIVFKPKYLYWYLKYNKEFLESRASGTTFKELSAQKCMQIDFPLAPLAEQARIVDRIEDIFEKLDLAKDKVQSISDSCEERRISILSNAFDGSLTRKWRKKNSLNLDNWSEIPLAELCDSFQYGTSRKSDSSGDIAVIRMGNLQNGIINWNNLAYTSNEGDIKKYLLKSGDVLFNRTNSPELVGKTSIYRGEQPAIFAGYLIRINYKKCLDGEYLNYFMNSKKARDYCVTVKSDGVNQSNINAQKLSKIKIPICSINEQKEIVSLLNELLGKEEVLKDLCNDIINQIEVLKNSIFKRAYCGMLGTNNSSDENPIYLIKQRLLELKNTVRKVEEVFILKKEVKFNLDMVDILKQKGKLTPEELKQNTKIEIDCYYEQLRDYIKREMIIEVREGKEVFLEAK